MEEPGPVTVFPAEQVAQAIVAHITVRRVDGTNDLALYAGSTITVISHEDAWKLGLALRKEANKIGHELHKEQQKHGKK